MKYCSTRGSNRNTRFVDGLLMGLAEDGGLLIPQQLPDVTQHLPAWRELSFVELAQAVIQLFVDDIDTNELDALIEEAYAGFDHADVAPLVELGNLHVLELFHGPTLAFKDVALQLLGRLFELALSRRGQRLNILGATSGDTGSAAIAGVRGQSNVNIFIMYPQGKVSRLQEMQMTTVPDSNVHCLSIAGSFDDCQSLMKSAFADLPLKQELQLGAVNSVNWARVLAQVVYYGYASLKFSQPVSFCVPTGNFGNIFAGYLARRIGFPIARLMVATNENDILARFFQSGEYARGDVHFTLSPAMDIQVASNFERYLYFHFDGDSQRLSEFMRTFQEQGRAALDGPPPSTDFSSTTVNTEQTLAAVQNTYTAHNYILDPHSAVGVAGGLRLHDAAEGPLICVATAHPAKFPDAIARALPGVHPTHPRLEALKDLPERKTELLADLEAIKGYLREAVA
ncbi:MAG: threonine synthase [Pseudomonadota bacterium]